MGQYNATANRTESTMQTIHQGAPHLAALPTPPTRAEAAAAELSFLAQTAADAPISQTGDLTHEVTKVLDSLSPTDVIQAAALLVQELRDQVMVTHFYQAGNDPVTPF